MSADVEASNSTAADADKLFLLTYPNLDDPHGKVVLSNEHVVLQRLYVPAGEWEGVHSHPGNQIYIHIVGGEWTGKLGEDIQYWKELSPTGEVGWVDAIPIEAEHDSGNTGDTPIDLIYVTLKSDSPIEQSTDLAVQQYPDLRLHLEFENPRVIVQRGFIEPGQWSGEHTRPGLQVRVMIRGGQLAERCPGDAARQAKYLEPGAAAWLEQADSVNFGNTGDTTIEFILVTIK